MIVGFIFIAIILWIVFELIKELVKREKEKNYIDPPEKLEEKRNELKQRIEHYKIDQQYAFEDYIFGFSNYYGLFVYYKTIYDSREQICIHTLPFVSVVDCKVILDGNFTIVGKNTAINMTSNSVDRNAVMENLLGVKNSVCSGMQICFITNDYETPAFLINIISKPLPRYTSEYTQICNDVYEIFVSALEIIEAQ